MAHAAAKQVEKTKIAPRPVKLNRRKKSYFGEAILEWTAVIVITPALVYGVMSLKDLPV